MQNAGFSQRVNEIMDNVPRTSDRKQAALVPRGESALAYESPETPPVVKKVQAHAFFGMNRDKTLSPQEELSKLRDLRTDDL